jgi:hypothetical protein
MNQLDVGEDNVASNFGEWDREQERGHFRVHQVQTAGLLAHFAVSRVEYWTLGRQDWLSQRLSMLSRLPRAPRFPHFVLCCSIALAAAVPLAPAQDIFVTPIPNVPFTAVVQVERSLVRPDGSVQKMKTLRQIARDSHGRIHNEMRTLIPISSAETPQLRRIHLYDPQTRISTMLDAEQQTFWTMTQRRPPQTVPPTLLEATPAGGTLEPSEFAKKEDLGIQEVGGIPAHGIREVQMIAAGGNGQLIVVTDEYWYCDDLRINLMIKHNDPRTGSATLTVTQVERSEPDGAMFAIPANYKRAGDP